MRAATHIDHGYVARAARWASARWYLSDRDIVAEWCREHADVYDDATELVDAMAERYGLEDPWEDWGPESDKPKPDRATI